MYRPTIESVSEAAWESQVKAHSELIRLSDVGLSWSLIHADSDNVYQWITAQREIMQAARAVAGYQAQALVCFRSLAETRPFVTNDDL